MTGPGPKIPEQPKQFVPGPAIRPTAPLLRWLNETVPTAAGPPTRVRLPVIVRFAQPHQPHIGIAEAFIGTVDRVDTETIFLELDDSAMGVSLFERVSERCSKSETACAVWLDGYWVSRIPTDRHREGMEARAAVRPEHWSFKVIRFHELLDGTTGEEAVHAQSESPSP
jgi:hypothetical protein